MKDLVFGISFKNHTFNIRTTPKTTLCFYQSDGKYTTSLIFAAHTYASVLYKNVAFVGSVTKQDNWHVSVDHCPVFRKRYNHYYFIPKDTVQNEAQSQPMSDSTTEYSGKILRLYSRLIELLQEQYLCIEDKETFREQLCMFLSARYSDDDVENLDQIVEYESWENIEPDEDPIIKKTTLKNFLIEECKDFFVSFRQAELDSKNKHAVLTLENIIKETPNLSEIPSELLEKEFNQLIKENFDDCIKLDILYSQSEALGTIGDSLYDKCKLILFLNTVEERIDKILSSMGIVDIDKAEIYTYFKKECYYESCPDDEAFEQSVRKFIGEYLSFNQVYEKFFSLFHDSYIKIEWDDEKLSCFQAYEGKGQALDSQMLAEYEVYKYVIPIYRRHFFCKNSSRYKPIIEQLPNYTAYASSVLDILFKYNVLTENRDRIAYNNLGDIESACEEIKAI